LSDERQGLTTNELAVDVNWKKIQGEVFRSPKDSTALFILVGMGA